MKRFRSKKDIFEIAVGYSVLIMILVYKYRVMLSFLCLNFETLHSEFPLKNCIKSHGRG